jgi:hypothetical protein
MKNLFARFALVAAMVKLLLSIQSVFAQGTAFTYQGRLNNDGAPANGSFDLTFTLFNINSGGAAVAGPVTNLATAVSNGLFTVTLDFGSNVLNPLPSPWLEAAVRTNGNGVFAVLSPRQQITPAPYAIYSEYSGAANSIISNSVSASQLNTLAPPSSGQVLTYSGSGLVWSDAAGASSGWSLTGNAGTVPGTDFLGTTDNEPLELWVNGMQAFTLEPVGGQVNVVGGVGSSAVSASGGTISGGIQNTVSNLYPTVGGGEYNTAGANGATVGGGYGNTATGNQSTIAGGAQNIASGAGDVVGGGGYDGTTLAGNTASGGAATVAGGMGNNAFYYAAVGGGESNNAGGYYSAVPGGYGNNASGSGAFIAGGYNNTASQFVDTVAGGVGNTASGGYSFAAGDGAQAINPGAFVWADFSSGTHFTSTAANQFSVRAYGGVRFMTGGAGMTIDGVPVGAGGGGGGSASNAWLLTGNSGANPANGYFLGTTDTNALELHVNGERGLRLDYVSQAIPDTFDYSYGINVNNGYWGNTITNGAVGATIAGGGSESQVEFDSYYYPNTVSGDFGTIGGGYGNVAGDYSTISGGYNNFAGNYATIPGGYNNYAVGNGSFALGRSASVSYDGSFVWCDGTSSETASGAHQFDVLATGGVSLQTGGNHSLVITSGGNVGINNNNPSSALDVGGEYIIVEGLTPVRCYMGDDGSGNDVQVGSLLSGVTAVSLYNEADSAYMHLYCSSITIEGGADVAEPFQISDAHKQAPEGAVVVIDEENPGQLKVSDRAYDTRVAGVVSGANGINPGIQMQQQGLLAGGKNVALTGRVYVQADASNGAIKPGDLLTTSASAGRAMRVSDHSKAEGAILGKAMTGLKEDKGMILMLVTLQ